MLYFAIALFALSVICIALYILIAKKVIRIDKRIMDVRILRKITGLGAVIALISAAVFIIIYIRSNNISFFDRIESYDPVKTYKMELKASGKDKAYSGLPDGIFSQNGDIYFKNGKGDLFKINEKTNVDKEGKESVTYSAETVANGVSYIGGKRTLAATLTDEGKLILDGYFLFSDYDGDRLSYDNEVIDEDVEYVTLTDNSLFYVKTNGKMYAIGFNEYGQLGDTTTKNKRSSTFIADDIKYCSISETHSMTVDKFGTLTAVGDNTYSQLGNKTAIPTTDPITIMQGAMDVKVGNYFSVVLAMNGEVYTAGTNEKGQLGNAGEAFKAELVPILSGIKKIDVNGDTCAALTYSGELYVWGNNEGTKAGVVGDIVVPSPVKATDNVLDFTLTENGVAVITNDRNILKSTVEGTFTEVLSFGAQIPDMYKPETELIDESKPDAA